MEENKDYIIYKVQAGYNYKVYRQDRNGFTFYKISVQKKLADGQKQYDYIPVTFKKGVDIQDKTVIKIKQAFENIVYKKEDIKHWNPMISIHITEFEVIDDKIDAYNQSLQEDVDVDDLF